MSPTAMAENVKATRNSVSVEMQVACDDPDIPSEADVSQWVEITLGMSEQTNVQAFELTVRVVDSAEMQTLNTRYRQCDQVTNVLSFPAHSSTGLPDGEMQLLGDIVICAPVVRDEAASQGKALVNHWAHMLVHGTLHLLGYDHQQDAEAQLMERLEATILAHRGVADPYASP